MAAFFIIGEQKTRPGVYIRYENHGGPPIAGVIDGICACVVRSNWGKVGESVLLEGIEDVQKYFGSGGAGGTTNVPYEMFRGGAREIYVARLGSGGTKGFIELESTTQEKVLKLVLACPGSRQFHVIIRESIDNDTRKELLLVEDTTVLQTISFIKGENEIDNLIEAYNNQKSDWFTLSKINSGAGELDIVDQIPITPGTDPVVTAGAYSEAFLTLEPCRWNYIAVDTEDSSIFALLHAFLNRVYQSGKLVMGVIGQPTSVPLPTRLTNSKAFNDYKIVYVGSGFKDASANEYNGYLAAARIAGMIAGTPSNESLTHVALTGATELTEVLTNSQYVEAINSGMLTFSLSPLRMPWIESGINSLVLTGTKEDVGWKKIKRTKVRFELMQRISDTVEPLIGRVNNDPDGRATIIQAAQGVCNTMMSEKKLLAGSKVILDPNNKPKGDSAWFVVYADDIDALEKMYFPFKFRFAPEDDE